jgi:glycosyltransferase involved in cell wall biosynthesis
LASTPNFPPVLSIPTVLFQHNVETMLWKRRAQFAKSLGHRAVSKLEHRKMERYESAQVRRFHHIIAVSQQDRLAMNAMTDPLRISVVPTGVDLREFRYDPEVRPSAPLVVFTGSMDWEPNIDGVEYFCGEIWPYVLQQVPRARFRIVGRNPDVRVKRLACASVEVTGSVPSIADHLREAMVVVVPLRIGGGTRIKIYEGMAMGKATVSTTVGAEGLDVRHGQDILLADESGELAARIIGLLSDESERRRYEYAAAKTAQRYDWSVVGEQFAEILKAAMCQNAEPVAVT